MALSNDLASQYAKITIAASNKKAPSESTVYGTVVVLEDKTYVKLDGSDLMTPVQITTTVSDGDRVLVTVKNHTATVTGNLKDPSVSGSVMQNQFEQTIIYADQIVAGEIEAIEGRFDVLDVGYAKIEELEAEYAKIGNLEADNVTIKGELNAIHAVIYDLDATYAKITDLEAINATIKNLDVENLDAKYADIDFINIGEAAIRNFYAKTGMIEDLVIEDGVVTGELTSVRINADYIQSGTLQTDRLMVKGEDGLYYRLNVTEGGATTSEKISEEDLQNGLHGTVIIAESITADKISVSDLYAFRATIGGYHITDHSLYSGVKESVENSTPGVYLDNEGQVNFGDMHDFVKFYKTTTAEGETTHKLEISASSIKLQAEGESSDVATSEQVSGVESNITETDKKIGDVDGKIAKIRSEIELLNDSIKTLVTGKDGSSLMVQNGDKWTFDISGIEQNLGNANQTLQDLMTTVGALTSVADGLALAVANLEETSEYVWITTYEDEPCLALGESDTTNGLFITNTRIIFIKEAGEPTYIDKDGLYTGRLEVGGEFRQKDFVWAVRANGNYGLSWKQVVLSSIQVTYVGPKNVKVGTDISKLTGIIVKGTYSNGRVRSIPNYEISGEIVEGESVITIKVNEITTTFTINGVDDSYVLGEATTYDISITSSAVQSNNNVIVYYSDSVEIIDGKARLKNAKNVAIYKTSHADYDPSDIELLYGKYACISYVDGDIYYVDPNASFTSVDISIGYGISSHVHRVSPAYKVEVVLVDVVLDSISVTYTGGAVPVGTPISSLTGITVTAKYSDNSTVTVVGYSMSGIINIVGTNYITITYNGKTARFAVEGIAEVAPTPTLDRITATYSGGDIAVGTAVTSLDKSKIIVTAYYTDGSNSKISSSDYTLSGPSSIASGNNIITVRYNNKTTTFTVNGVEESVEVTLDSIEATWKGGTVYIGQTINDINKSDIEVIAVYTDGSRVILQSSDFTLSRSGGAFTSGTNAFTVRYGAKFDTIIVTAVDAPGGSSSDLVIKRGTTTSPTINTGLSKINHLMLNVSSFSATGLIDVIYTEENGTLYTYCSNYAAYSRIGVMADGTSLVTIQGGTFKWSGTNYSAMATDKSYSWVAIGEE